MTVATIPRSTVAAPRPRSRRITGEELLAMGDIGPCELVEGRIVRRSFAQVRHGCIESTLGCHLGGFVDSRKIGRVTGGGVGIYTRFNPDTVRAADIVFVSKERQAGRPGPGFLMIAPDLVVEIMSPTDRWQEVRRKIEEYFAIGTQRVWIVEPDNRAALVYSASAALHELSENDTLTGEGVLEGFTLPVAELFEE